MTTDPVLQWLLEPEQPAVRHRAMLDLQGLSQQASEVRKTLAELPKRGWVHDILKKQKARGYWEARKDLYRPKYLATIWRLIVLADLGMTAKDPRIRKPCEFFLQEYVRPDGGFDTPTEELARSELCITGNLARTFVRCGYENDPRVKHAYDWLVENQMRDGGWHCFYRQAFGRGTLDCWEALSAFSVLPKNKWSKKIRRAVARGAEFYLNRYLFQQGKARYAPWFRFHYPVHYYHDLLVGLDTLTSLGYGGDPRLKPALEIMEKKRLADGTWALDAVHPDLGKGSGYRLKRKVHPFALELPGRRSKWITLIARRVLKRVAEET